MREFKILSLAPARLQGNRDKIYAPHLKQASSCDEIPSEQSR
ncbi:hypothetical protein [uncultured Campylobacter sp.]|nr:hypothetical protein [uncultured Campylobacter sp.]